jgi:hypothetical protein
MQDNDIGLILAVSGLGLWLAFTQTARHLAINAVSKLLAVLIIPIAIAAIWRIALDLRWWTILLFVAASLTVGVINGIAMRKIGKAEVYSIQTAVGLVGALLVAVSWFLR